MDTIAVLDFGSQYAQLIARRLREAHVYAELHPWNAAGNEVLGPDIKGFVLSGGPASVYQPAAPQVPAYVLASGLPILGICYGMQALTHALGGQVDASAEREYGPARIEVLTPSVLSGLSLVWMSHGDRITRLPSGFVSLAKSDHSPMAAIGDLQRKYFGVQFHPEVHHTPNGASVLRHFAVEICGAAPEWTPRSIVAQAMERIRQQVGEERVLSAVSGGVDSSVATTLVHKAIGDQLAAVFVDTGLLRQGEAEQVVSVLRERLHVELISVEAARQFVGALQGVTEPEQKRRIVGEKFVRLFEEQARQLGNPRFLVQGTIYPDVVESSAPDRGQAERIKSHHNVGGLPQDLPFELVEPLRYLFKDEVRLVGEELGLPESLVWRQPFPGPGLSVRCLGEVTFERLDRLRAADAIFMEELARAGLLGGRSGGEADMSPESTGAVTDLERVRDVAQAFVVLLPVRSVGVMGDQRTYQETAALRAVTTEDFMTADWARLPHQLLAHVAGRIVNEVDGINRVVYDVTSKPPATIEWE
ncbi:MAG: glutamine-hydrolyzing GMP synthase [Anaerolineales bacterium]